MYCTRVKKKKTSNNLIIIVLKLQLYVINLISN